MKKLQYILLSTIPLGLLAKILSPWWTQWLQMYTWRLSNSHFQLPTTSQIKSMPSLYLIWKHPHQHTMSFLADFSGFSIGASFPWLLISANSNNPSLTEKVTKEPSPAATNILHTLQTINPNCSWKGVETHVWCIHHVYVLYVCYTLIHIYVYYVLTKLHVYIWGMKETIWIIIIYRIVALAITMTTRMCLKQPQFVKFTCHIVEWHCLPRCQCHHMKQLWGQKICWLNTGVESNIWEKGFMTT